MADERFAELSDNGGLMTPVPWGMSEAILALVTGYILFPDVFISLAIEFLAPGMSEDARFLVRQFASLFCWVLIFWGLGRAHRRPMSPYLGLTLTRPRGYYLKQGGIAIFGIFGIMALLSIVSQFLGLPAQDPGEFFPREKLPLIAFFAIVTAPILEELIFRGFLQSTFEKYVSFRWAILLTVLVFTLLHPYYLQSPIALAYVASLGLLLGWLRHRSGSTVPGMIGHLFNNLLASLVFLGRP